MCVNGKIGNYTQCIKFRSPYGSTIFTENLCSHGFTTGGLVDAHELDIQMDTKADRLAEEPG